METYEFEGKKYRKGKCLAGEKGAIGRLCIIHTTGNKFDREVNDLHWDEDSLNVFEAIPIEEPIEEPNAHSSHASLIAEVQRQKEMCKRLEDALQCLVDHSEPYQENCAPWFIKRAKAALAEARELNGE